MAAAIMKSQSHIHGVYGYPFPLSNDVCASKLRSPVEFTSTDHVSKRICAGGLELNSLILLTNLSAEAGGLS
jgi:hypothetical protein